MNIEIRELNAAEITTVAGGYDDIPFCGTIPRPWPFPTPYWNLGNVINPVINPIVIGSFRP